MPSTHPSAHRPGPVAPAGWAEAAEGPELMTSGGVAGPDAADRHLVVVEQRGGVADSLSAAVASLDDEGLERRARELAGLVSTAQADLALTLAEIDRRALPGQWECASAVSWAGWRLGLGPGAARNLVCVGHAMADMPTMAEAVCDATISFDKANAVARTADPLSEQALVSLAAQATPAQTQRACGQWRRTLAAQPEITAGDPPGDEATEGSTPAELTYHPEVLVVRDHDGIELHARFDHVDGELALVALERFTDAERTARRDAAPADPAAERRHRAGSVDDAPREPLTRDQWRGHGLLALLSAAAATDAAPSATGPNGFATQVVLHVGVDHLLDPADGHCPDCGQPVQVVGPTRTERLEAPPPFGWAPPSGPDPTASPAAAGVDDRTGEAGGASPAETAAAPSRSPDSAATDPPATADPRGASPPPGPPTAAGPPSPPDQATSTHSGRRGPQHPSSLQVVGDPGRGDGEIVVPPPPDPPGPLRQLEPRGIHLRRDLSRFLACDAGFLTVVDDPDGTPLHLGPRVQTVTPTLRRAMYLRYRHCQWPGCVATRVDAHHRHHRHLGGHDDVENLLPLCHYHHRQTHLRRITVTTDATGRPVFTRPDGTVLQATPTGPGEDGGAGLEVVDASRAGAALFDRHVGTGADPLEPARYPRWQGDRLRLVDAIDTFLAGRARAVARTRAS